MDNMGLIYIQREGNWSVKETSAPFTIAEKWKQPKCPRTDEWVDHVIHIHSTLVRQKEWNPVICNSMDGASVH
jgi:hypothetical protein